MNCNCRKLIKQQHSLRQEDFRFVYSFISVSINLYRMSRHGGQIQANRIWRKTTDLRITAHWTTTLTSDRCQKIPRYCQKLSFPYFGKQQEVALNMSLSRENYIITQKLKAKRIQQFWSCTYLLLNAETSELFIIHCFQILQYNKTFIFKQFYETLSVMLQPVHCRSRKSDNEMRNTDTWKTSWILTEQR